MVYDSLDNFKNYLSLHPQFKDAAAYFSGPAFASLDLGAYAVNDAGSSVSKSAYTTKALQECFIEGHKKFIDIHIVLKGREKIGVCNVAECRELSYDPIKDFAKLNGSVEFITLVPGYFMLLFPQDAHMPQGQCAGFGETVVKAVFKVPVL